MVPHSAVKFVPGSDDTLDILAVPFGGPLDGRDLDGEYFSPRTDLCLSWFPAERPLLYDHGLDDALKADVIGRIDSATLRTDEDGHWVRAQLNRAHGYFRQVKQLIGADALGSSSGSVPHLARVAKSGEILRWPWIEQSLTPTPANPYARVSVADASKHYEAALLEFDLPRALKALAEGAVSSGGALVSPQYGSGAGAWSAAAINDLPDSAFAVILPGGSKDDAGKTTPRSLRKLPHHTADGKIDLPHLRNALARISQTSLPASEQATAQRHLDAHAKAEGVGDATSQKARAFKQGSPEGSYEDLIADVGALTSLRTAETRLAQVLAHAEARFGVTATKDARVLSGANYGRAKLARGQLDAMIGSHEAAMAKRG